jgi:hypothetical protein
MTENLDQTIEDLRQELARIEAAIVALEALGPGQRSNRGRKSMGMEERLDVSARMKKYWADRRARNQLQVAG